MTNVVKFRKASPADRHKGKSLCRHGFHKWEVVEGTPFDVKSGRLVTRYRCVRCQATRVEGR